MILAAICHLGFLYAFDNNVSDAVFQKSMASDGDIIIIGIDS